MDRIYLSPPHMGGQELDYVRDAFDSNWIAPLGPHVDAFEREFASTVAVPHAAALSSGTAALHLGLILCGVEPGDTVLVSSLTFAATANAVVHAGARPAFIDSDQATWTMDPELLAEALASYAARSQLPTAVIVVDVYGQAADYDRIERICDEYEVPLIEDAAEALGASYGDVPVGGFGRCGVFSFNGNKIITTSGGGMLASADEALIGRARFLSTQARDPAPHYQHSEIGYNYRMSNVLAAIGRGQLQVLSDRVDRRRAVFEHYFDRLGEYPGVQFMPEADYGRASRWLTCLTIEPESFGATRDDVRRALEEANIEARPMWKPMHLQPVFSDSEAVGGTVSARLFELGLCLPSGSGLTTAQLDRVCEIVASCSQR